MNIPHIDVQKQTELTEAQIKFFNDNGFLVLRNALSKEVRIINIFPTNKRLLYGESGYFDKFQRSFELMNILFRN